METELLDHMQLHVWAVVGEWSIAYRAVGEDGALIAQGGLHVPGTVAPLQGRSGEAQVGIMLLSILQSLTEITPDA